MINCANPEMYENRSIIILIEWLFSKFKYKILLARLPLYIGQVATFILAMMMDDKISDNNSVKSPGKTYSNISFVVLIFVVLANLWVMLY
jgi:hypothetical protein